MIAFLSDDIDDDFDDDDLEDGDFDDGDFDDDDEMDPEEALRIVTKLLGYDPATVDQETLQRDIHTILDGLARRLAEI